MMRTAVRGGAMADPAFRHEPVMTSEVVDLLRPVPGGVLVDANVGGGGHAAAVLEAHAGLRLIGLDLDGEAVAAARERLAPFAGRVSLHQRAFDTMRGAVTAEGHGAEVSAVLFDLGLSSPQVDRPGRGFSFHDEGPLDMRFDQSSGPTAADVVNEGDEREIERLLRENADERHARAIARAIVQARPIGTTLELAEVVAGAVPAAARRRGHPARRTFQALRMAVNDELARLRSALLQAIDLLVGGGRLVVLSYHSGEDRLVKETLREAATGGCTCPPALPCGCGAVPSLRLLRPLSRTPSASEVAANPRARSARLRAAEKLPGEATPGDPTTQATATTGARR